ncbi:Vascular endothelial growth factor receptor 3, partial [Armadillidium nasatum]
MLVVNGTPKAQFSEIPSVLPPDKNFTITLFILAFDLNKSEPDVSCYLESNCSGIPICKLESISSESYKLEKDIGPPNRFKVVLFFRLSSSTLLLCRVNNGIENGDAGTYLTVSNQLASFMVMIRSENALVNLTTPGTSEIINVTEGDNINIACFALDYFYYYVSFNYSEKIAPRLLSSSNVSLEGTEIRVKSPFPFFIACYVEGRPKPKITWLKDGENIDEIIENNDEVSLSDDNQILDFKSSIKKYEGKYKCKVENRVGHIQPFANVIIEGNVGKLNKECTIEEQAELLPYDNSFEVERANITLGKQLGAGAFGRVLLAQVKGLNGKESPTRVALKMCKFEYDKTHLRALIMELKIMIHLGKHLNIVNLLGAHTSNIDKGELWILVEYCKYGNLLKFIQRGKAQFINQM